MRQGFIGRLPRPVRWLWLAVLAGVALECAALGLGWALGGMWLVAALQLSSVLAAPLVLGLLIAIAAARWTGRGAQPPSGGGRSGDSERPRQADRPRTEPSSSAVPLEVTVGRRAGEVVTALGRSPEGKAAIRRTARLVRSIRAAASPPPGLPDDPERRSREP